MTESMAAYENLLKGLDVAKRTAGNAALATQGLDDKLRFQSLARTISDARSKLRLMYNEYEDACNVVVSKCPHCNSVV